MAKPSSRCKRMGNSRKARVITPAWADREHLVLFLERGRKPQPSTNIRGESDTDSQGYSQVRLFLRQSLLTLGMLLMAGALLWWRSSHVTGGGIHNSPRVCMCVVSNTLFFNIAVDVECSRAVAAGSLSHRGSWSVRLFPDTKICPA